MLRASMKDIVDRVRVLIADFSVPYTFTDDQLQDALDRRRIEKRHVALRPDPSFQPGGSVLFLDFYSDAQNWESDILLQDMSWNTLTPTLAEPIVGHWSFAAQPNGIGICATGKTYDLYGSAADLLESWAGKVKLDFDVKLGLSAYQRQQKFSMLMEMARQYRQLALVQTSPITQHDAASDFGGNAVTYPTYGDDGYGY